MGEIKFGVSFHEYYDLQEVVRYVQRVEELGFDSLWITENVHSEVPVLEPMIALTSFAIHTTRVTVGPGVLLLPLRNPVGLAHAAATLDRLSGGRFILGVGAGGEAPEGFQAYGIPIEERGPRCDEALEIITRLWTGEPVTHHGEFFSFSDYTLGARPMQRPHPPIWLGGSTPAVVRRVARWGDGFYPAHKTPSQCAELYRRVRQCGQEYGRDMAGFTNAVYLFLCLSDSREGAMRVTQKVLQERYGYPFSGLAPGENSLQGDPDDCIRLLKQYVDAGVSHFVIDPTCPTEDILSQYETFARMVMPRFR